MRAHVRAVVLLLGMTLLLTGCRLDLDTNVHFRADDTVDIAVSAGVDRAFHTQLNQFGIDPVALLSGVQVFDWELSRRIEHDGTRRFAIRRQALPPNAVAATLGELSAGLGDEDVGLRYDLEVTSVGRVHTVTGTAEFTPPTNPGFHLDGTALRHDNAAIAAQVAAHVTTTFTVSVDGTIIDTNADEHGTQQARWQLHANDPLTIAITVETARRTGEGLIVVLLLSTLAAGAGWLGLRKFRHAGGHRASEAT